ncbi:MAG: amidase [Nitratireductor sp.]|nr:amidase [Nitratireductor sp.]
MNEICTWSAIETRDKIDKRQVSVLEVATAHLAHADAINAQINALPEILHEEALATAVAQDNLPTDAPDRDKPLFGLPVTTKINVDQKGTVNSNGLAVLAGNIAQEDSPLVRNMRNDGAVLFGRTNTPEFSLRWFTSNPLNGVTCNIWNAAITPGGSSGGAASSVAAGVGVIAHGNDLGGSLRYPAYCCGVASIRPSMGRVPAFNPSGKVVRPPMTQQMSVQGPIARSIADVRLGLASMARRDARDPLWQCAPSSGINRDGRKLRIGYCVDAFGDSDDPQVHKAVELAVAGLRAAGHELVESVPPEMKLAAETWGLLLSTETELLSGEAMRQIGSKGVVSLFEAMKAFYGTTDLKGFLVAMLERMRLQAEWSRHFELVDLVLMPTSGALPFDNDADFNSPAEIPAMLRAQKYLYVINMLGLPSVAVPTHVANPETDPRPVGVQLVGPMNDDALCLDVAESVEREIGRPITGLRLP